jgi:hypothetical protein
MMKNFYAEYFSNQVLAGFLLSQGPPSPETQGLFTSITFVPAQDWINKNKTNRTKYLQIFIFRVLLCYLIKTNNFILFKSF